MDFYIRETKNAIINYINTRDIPLEIKRLIVSEILTEISGKADEVIREQIKAKESEEKHDGD